MTKEQALWAIVAAFGFWVWGYACGYLDALHRERKRRGRIADAARGLSDRLDLIGRAKAIREPGK